MKYLMVFILFNVLQYTALPAQNYFSRFYDFVGDNDGAWKIVKAKDQYFILSANFCHQNRIGCAGILCLDINFNLLWKIELDSVGPVFSESFTTDNNYLYLVVTPEYDPNYRVRFYKIDLNGNVIKRREYGPYPKMITPISLSHHLGDIHLTVSYFHDRRVSGFDSSEVWYMNKDFDIKYKFSDTNKRKSENLVGFEPTADGHFVSFKPLLKKNDGTEGLVKKFDSIGNLIWSSLLPWESGYRVQYGNQKIKATRDNGCIGMWNQTIDFLFPDTFPNQPILFKLDGDGKLVWSKTFFSKQPKKLNSLFEAANGDIIGIGDDENTSEFSRYKLNGWMVRLSKDGDLLEERSYNDTVTWSGYSHFYDGIEGDNGNLIFCGSIMPKRKPGIILNVDDWIVHTDKNGCLLPNCDSFQLLTKLDDLALQEANKIQYTNPVINECNIQSDINLFDATITITDLNSCKIYELKEVQFPLKFDLSFLKKGIYFMTIQASKTNFIKTFKLLKL